MDDYIFLLRQLYGLYDIPMRIINTEGDIHYPDNKFRDVDPLIQDEALMKYLIGRWNGFPVMELENDTILYGICRDIHETTCILGPIAIKTLTASEQYQYKNRHNLLAYTYYKIQYGTLVSTASALSLVHEKMNHESIDYTTIMSQLVEDENNQKISEKDIYHYSLQNSEKKDDFLPRNVGDTVISAIMNGDMNTLKASWATNNGEHIGMMAITPLKQTEYLCVTGMAMFTRAAIKGGTNQDEACSISDLYLQKISICQDELEMKKLFRNAQFALCECVIRSKSKKNGIKFLDDCKQYIAQNLRNPITLDDISRAVGISKCYLTHQFSQQEGKSLKRHIHEERIKAAQNMLKYSDYPVPMIAAYFCFDSQSHFGSVFKKITGTTPTAYRKQNYVEDFLL